MSTQLTETFKIEHLEQLMKACNRHVMVCCPVCSFPMFSVSENDPADMTFMVEGSLHGTLFRTKTETVSGECPSCFSPFNYTRGYLTTHFQQKARLRKTR